MTFLQVSFEYDGWIEEHEAQCLAMIRNVYGIWKLLFDERNQKITVEYDSSRLQRSDVAFMLRNAGIHLRSQTGPAV